MINGIDGCRAGWFVFTFYKDRYTFKVVKNLEEIREFLKKSKINLIDIPLGLEDSKPSRECDDLLKSILKKKASSIFNAPVYELLDSESYLDACELSYKLTGKKISIQTWNIIPKIRDANYFLRNSENKNLLKEFHPETGFIYLNNKNPLNSNKKTNEGISERLNILNKYLDAEKIYTEIISKTKRKDVARDDILDAMCCAVSASYSESLLKVPSDARLDKHKIPLEILLPCLR